jgi:hypothetical protein
LGEYLWVLACQVHLTWQVFPQSEIHPPATNIPGLQGFWHLSAVWNHSNVSKSQFNPHFVAIADMKGFPDIV